MEWFKEGIIALISGMSAVFLILIVISMMISYLGRLGEKNSVKGKKVLGNTVAGLSDVFDQHVTTQDEERHRIVAAITVSLAQQIQVPIDSLRIRSIRRM